MSGKWIVLDSLWLEESNDTKFFNLIFTWQVVMTDNSWKMAIIATNPFVTYQAESIGAVYGWIKRFPAWILSPEIICVTVFQIKWKVLPALSIEKLSLEKKQEN